MDETKRQQAILLFDRFTHEGMERRRFMAEMTRIAGSAAAATALIGSISASPAAAAIVPEAHAASEVAADLLVVGTHARGGLRHALIGSVAEELVRTAPCEVLVARGELILSTAQSFSLLQAGQRMDVENQIATVLYNPSQSETEVVLLTLTMAKGARASDTATAPPQAQYA